MRVHVPAIYPTTNCRPVMLSNLHVHVRVGRRWSAKVNHLWSAHVMGSGYGKSVVVGGRIKSLGDKGKGSVWFDMDKGKGR